MLTNSWFQTILGNFTETNITVNRKTPKGLDSFHRLEVAEAPVHALDTDTKEANIASSAEIETELPKRDCFSLIAWETQTEGKLTVDAMTHTSDQNRDTEQESINIDLLKLLKDEIVFLRVDLSREFR